MNINIFQDMARRTGGEIHIGVVGPVRCGKSTFIKKFMETTVIPGIVNEFDRTRATDELPQSAGGKTVMTTEPKFIPDEAVTVSFADGAVCKVRMIDCVGYMIPDAIGNMEEGQPRMVRTPWSEEPMPFEEAAETGTRKVIRDHSTVGILVTTDGTIGDIPRSGYVEAEERVAGELREINKPFAIILNSADPSSESAEALAAELEQKYHAPVALVSCMDLDRVDVDHILEMLMFEFPVVQINVEIPGWISALDSGHPLKSGMISCLGSTAPSVRAMSDVKEKFVPGLITGMNTLVGEMNCGGECRASVGSLDMGTGVVSVRTDIPRELYYKVIGELTGIDVSTESELMEMMCSLAETKRNYDKFARAIESVDHFGYGIVMPEASELTLAQPEIVKQAGGYGVKLKATAPSIHLIRADIDTEINPMIGTQQQSEELVKSLLSEYEDDPERIWDTNMFGKSLYELVSDGLNGKLTHIPDEARAKLSETLSRIINEGSGGLICIIL